LRRFHLETSPAPVRRRLLLEWMTLGVVASIAVVGLVGLDAVRRLDNIVYDVIQRLDRPPVDPSILLVEIDDRSIAELGPWPWPRAIHARAIERLAAARPAAIAYDILFAERSASDADDAALEAAIRDARMVHLPSPYVVEGGEARAGTLLSGAAALGLVRVHSDVDGLVRRTFPVETQGGALRLDLIHGLHRATEFPGALSPAPQSPAAQLIPFVGASGSFPAVSFASLSAGEVPAEMIRGKTVLVGVTATGLGERFSTPVTGGRGSLSGIELQANILNGLRNDAMIRPAGLFARALFALLPLWTAMALVAMTTPRRALGGTMAIGAAALTLSICLYLGLRFWVSPVTPILAMAVVLSLWGWRRLVVVNDYVVGELRRLGAVPGQPSRLGEDVLTSHALSLSAAIDRIDGLRRFTADALFGLPDATLLIDADGAVIDSNGAAEALFRRTAAIPLGGQASDLINGLGSPMRFAAGWPVLQPFEQGQMLHLPDGRCFELQVAGRPSSDGPDGENRGGGVWILRLADITALVTANRQRERALQMLSHDMRSPQVSILALIETAEGDLDGDTGGRIAGYARRTLDMADGFVQLARAEEAAPGQEVIDLWDVVCEATDEIWPQSQRRRIEVRRVPAAEPALVRGDRQILTRAVTNLLTNAIKFGPEASVVEVRVYRRFRARQPTVGIAVQDAGPGLNPIEATRAFEAFSRLGRDQAIDGVGLGLAFVRAAAQRHGGVAACVSALGEGATFTIELPEWGEPEPGEEEA